MRFANHLLHVIREDEPLAPYCWLRIGGLARFFAEPNSIDEFQELVQEASRLTLPVRLLGDGSNVLVREAGADGLVIRLATAELSSIHIEGNRLRAGAGAKLGHVISAAVAAGLGGIEHLAGIPGTIGAAVVTNAGGTNDDIGCRVTKVELVDRQGQQSTRCRDKMQFGFRRSNLQDVFLTEIELTLEESDAAELTRRMQSSWIIRRAAQPPTGTRTAQAFIESDGTDLSHLFSTAGLKGAIEGHATLSDRYPGFIVVSGDATSADVLALLTRVTRSVEAQTGIALQSQLRIW